MFAALVRWLGGGVLYLWLMTLIFYRYTFVRMSPEDLAPPYWINMGAVAISTLAGAFLSEHSALSPVVMELRPFVKGLTLSCWAIGSLWIPLLVVLRVWRYLIRGVPFTYDLLYLGCGLPAGDVFRVHVSLDGGPGGAVSDAAIGGVHDHCRGRLGGGFRRIGRQPPEPHGARSILDLEHPIVIRASRPCSVLESLTAQVGLRGGSEWGRLASSFEGLNRRRQRHRRSTDRVR